MLDVLDSDGMIIIDDYLISLDFVNEVAGVTTDFSLTENMKNKDFSSPGIDAYPFEEEVLSILFGEGEQSESRVDYLGGENLRVESCPGTPAPGLSLAYRPTTPNPNPSNNRVTSYDQFHLIGGSTPREFKIQAKHAYQAAAIYFRLKSELEHYQRPADGNSIFQPEKDDSMSITYWGDFTPNNRAKVFLNGCWETCQGCSPQPANKQKVQKVHHEASRRLTQVNLHGIYRGHLGGDRVGAQHYEFRLVPINR